MGQIRGKNAHIDACNLRSLSSFGIPAAGQHILVSTDNSATADGQGNFDCYIEGDGTTAATALPLKTIADTNVLQDGKNSVTGGGVHTALKDGIQSNVFAYSSFESVNKNIALSSALTFSQIGDYIEMDVNPNGLSWMLWKTAAYNSPYIRYSSLNGIAIRLTMSAAVASHSFSTQRSKDRQVIRLELTADDGTNKTFTLFVDGVQILTSSVTSSSTVSYDNIGGTTTMDLYAFRFRLGGTDGYYTKFGEMEGAIGVTDHYDSAFLNGLERLNEDSADAKARISALEEKVGGSDMYIRFRADSGIWNAYKCLYIYQRLHDNVYIMTLLILYDTKDSGSSQLGSWGYWRLERTNIITLENGTEVNIFDQALTAGENEFVIQYTNAAANYDGGYTGGFHFGEKIGDEGTFVNILVDGNPLDLSADIPLTPCKSVEYKELSAIYEHVNNTIAAYHYKHTKFLDGGYDTFNKVKFTQALSYFAYLGIVCVGRNVSEYAMPENVNTITDMGTGTPLQSEQFKSNHHLIHYEGGGYAVDVRSECEFGDDDSLNSLVVYNSTTYNKFYRRTQTIDASVLNRVGGKTSVRFHAL